MEKNNTCKTPRWLLLKAQLNNLTSQAFRAKMEMEHILIVDVRTATEFAEMHIKNALHIDYFEENFWEKIEQLDATKDILVYCRSGRRSIRVCTLMKNGGFEAAKIFNLEGGIVDWMQHYSAEIA